jgi:hypothetical protein
MVRPRVITLNETYCKILLIVLHLLLTICINQIYIKLQINYLFSADLPSVNLTINTFARIRHCNIAENQDP